MTKSKDKPSEKPRRSAVTDDDSGHSVSVSSSDDPSAWSRTVRETIESVVIAFVLAFLFRTFEAEAFVIPTGSMAPTLMGRHMDSKCPKCGYAYQVGAGQNEDSTPVDDRQFGVCPICGYVAKADQGTRYYNGDRILVNKFVFDFAEPQRWDVIVFKFPEDSKTNYIKRLIGLPGEVIRIRDGDITVSVDSGKTFKFVPRDPAKMRAMLQTVYDNDYVFEPFLAKGWPVRWQTRDPGWTVAKRDGGTTDPKMFVFEGKGAGGDRSRESWLRYYNFLPSPADWSNFESNQPLNPNPPVQPITDAIAYDRSGVGANKVSDLAVECEVNVKGAAGTILLELSNNGRRFRCQLDLSNGAAQLFIPGRLDANQPRATEGGTPRAGTYRLLFANIDHQLTMLVNNKPIHFDKPTMYDDLDAGDRADGQASLTENSSPVGIGSTGASFTVSHLRVLRDIYYTYIESYTGPGSYFDLVNRPSTDNPDGDTQPHPNYRDLGGPRPPSWPDANRWLCFPRTAIAKLRDAGTEVREWDQYFFVGRQGDGTTNEDQFFPLGDNSPSSQDGRLWFATHFVDRRLLVGKALFIYWPHSFDKIRFTDDHSIPFPFFPNFGRMGFVR